MPPFWSISPTRDRRAGPPRRRVLAEDADAPAVAAPVALDDLDGRRLAGAVRTEHRDELAGRDRERDAVEDRPAAIPLDESVDHDRGLTAAGRHGAVVAILAYCLSKSASVSSPTWMDRSTPLRSTK